MWINFEGWKSKNASLPFLLWNKWEANFGVIVAFWCRVYFLQCIRWMSWWALMDMLTAQESVFTAAALRQAADQYTAAQLSAQPTSRSAPAQISRPTPTHTHTHTHTHKHTHIEMFSISSCWKGMTIVVLHQICSKMFGMCMSTNTHSVSFRHVSHDSTNSTSLSQKSETSNNLQCSLERHCIYLSTYNMIWD